MNMAVGCIDVHDTKIKDKYDVIKVINIIFDDTDLEEINRMCRMASANEKCYVYRYRDIIQR